MDNVKFKRIRISDLFVKHARPKYKKDAQFSKTNKKLSGKSFVTFLISERKCRLIKIGR